MGQLAFAYQEQKTSNLIHPDVTRLMKEYGVTTELEAYTKAYERHAEYGDTLPGIAFGYGIANRRWQNAPTLPPYVKRALQHHFGLMT
ncbi:MAG: hypothetical protein WA021_04940 [Minisyncoccia bacterium]